MPRLSPPFPSVLSTPRPPGSPPRRLTVLAGACAMVVGILTGCATTEGTSSANDTTTVVSHVYGETNLPPNPSAVISLVPGYTDAMLALDATPAAIAGYAGFPSAVLPWEEGRLRIAPEGTTEVLALLNPSYVPVEEIASREPDAVLGSSLLSDEETYNRVSLIAPAVPALHTPPRLDGWDEQTRVVGDMLGKKDRAEEAIADVNAQIDAFAKDYPQARGATVAVALYGGPDNIQVVSDPDDVTMSTLSRLGLRLPPQIEHLGGGEGGNQGRLSLENLDKLDADIIILGSLGDTEALTSAGLWQSLDAVANGRVIALDPAGVTAFRVPTILSIPWSMDLLRPALEKL